MIDSNESPVLLSTDLEKGTHLNPLTSKDFHDHQSLTPDSAPDDPEQPEPVIDENSAPTGRWLKDHSRPILHLLLALLLLGWYIPGLINPSTRHKWIITTVWTSFFLLILANQYAFPVRVFRSFTRPLFVYPTRLWGTLPRWTHFAIGWATLAALILGPMFGLSLKQGTTLSSRAISLLGLIVFQTGFWLTSHDRNKIRWRTVLIGLILQQVLALFVLQTSAGFDLFNWIATAFTDLLGTGTRAGAFFFSEDVIKQNWFFVNVLSAIVYFIALVQLLYYLGVMQWVLLNIGWLFFKIMAVSGAEAVVAAASPFVGQAESVVLVRPFVSDMTSAEFHQVVTSGFATIAGSVLAAYVSLGMPAVYLISASMMSIPASLAISKLRYPETGTPLTAGKISIPTQKKEHLNLLHAFSNGAWFGLKVAGMILANVLSILALVYTVNGLLTWIGQFWSLDPHGPHPLTLELIFQYLFFPIAWLMGTPWQDVTKVSKLLGLKLVANEFVAYQELSKLKPEMTERGFVIATYSLCGFANLGGLGIQIGILGSMAPHRQGEIGKIVISALICGFFSTIQTAAIAGMLI